MAWLLRNNLSRGSGSGTLRKTIDVSDRSTIASRTAYRSDTPSEGIHVRQSETHNPAVACRSLASVLDFDSIQAFSPPSGTSSSVLVATSPGFEADCERFSLVDNVSKRFTESSALFCFDDIDGIFIAKSVWSQGNLRCRRKTVKCGQTSSSSTSNNPQTGYH